MFEVRRSLQLIEDFPAIGGEVPGVEDANVRQMPIHTFPYNVVVDNFGETREVVAFAHKRKRPAYLWAGSDGRKGIGGRCVRLTDLGFSRAVPARAEANAEACYLKRGAEAPEPTNGTASAANQSWAAASMLHEF